MSLPFILITATIGAIIGIFIKWFWYDGLPWAFQYLSRSGLVISGRWKTSFKEEGKQYNETALLKQRGQKVLGTIVLNEEGKEIIYKFNGTFKDLILSGTYASTDETNFERGTILLRYVKRGKAMKFIGQNSFFSKDEKEDKLVSSPYEWTFLGKSSKNT
jgi:hypothetical protein